MKNLSSIVILKIVEKYLLICHSYTETLKLVSENWSWFVNLYQFFEHIEKSWLKNTSQILDEDDYMCENQKKIIFTFFLNWSSFMEILHFVFPVLLFSMVFLCSNTIFWPVFLKKMRFHLDLLGLSPLGMVWLGMLASWHFFFCVKCMFISLFVCMLIFLLK